MLRRYLLAIVFVLSVSLGWNSASAQIKIATAGPMTGQYAAFGAQMKEGAQQAVDDINKSGGVLGQQLQLTIGDDACDPRQAVSVANSFASQGVKFVAGHYCSGSSIPAGKIYAEEGILQMTPATTNPDFTDKGTWSTFRLCGRDDQQGAVAGDYIAMHYKDNKVAILNDNTAYGKGLAEQAENNMQVKGLQPAMVATYTPGENDYAALVSRMKAAGINVIYIGGYYAEAGLIIRQAKEQGLNPTLISGDALATKEFWRIAGPAGQGTIMTLGPDLSTLPSAAAVVKEFTDRKVDPEGYTLYTYATIQIWAQAAKKANSTDPKKVAAELKSGGPWQSIIGPISFDKKGDVEAASYVLYYWNNGKYSELRH